MADRPADAARLIAFLRLVFVFAAVFAGVYAFAAFRQRQWALGGAAALCLATAFATPFLRRQALRGAASSAAVRTAAALLALTSAFSLVAPFAWPALVLTCMVVAALALPFVGESALRGLLVASFAVTVLVMAVGATNPVELRFHPHFEWALLAANVVAASGIAFWMLWRFSRRQRELLERAEAARAEAEAASRAKDEFLAMLGHELRNPLAPIVTALELIHIRGDSKFDRELAIIERQVKYLHRLVDDVLDVSRIARGLVELRLAQVELGRVVGAAMEMSSPLLESKNQRVELDVPAEGLPLNADEGRLAQVVCNLLTNAAKYTPAGGRISLRASRSLAHRELVVADEGEGIAPELLPRVFEPFVQGEPSLPRRQGGLGLGLTLVRNLVERHGGAVRAESEGLGRGARFTVSLPVANASD